MRLYVSLAAASMVVAVALLTACNSNEANRSQGGSTASQPSATTSSSSSSSARPPVISNSPNPVALATPALSTPADGAARITPEEVRSEVLRNNAFIIDVRNDAAYTIGHIKGAILIPAQDILSHTDQLPHNKLIITYCS